MENRAIARHLLDLAHDLEAKRTNFYRVKAYRQAAQTILSLDRPIGELVADQGRKGLKQLPGIGGSMSEKIEKLVRAGDIATLKEDCDSRLVAV